MSITSRDLVPRLSAPPRSLPRYKTSYDEVQSWPVPKDASEADLKLFSYCANIADEDACRNETICGVHRRQRDVRSKLDAYDGCMPRKYGGRGYLFPDKSRAAMTRVQVVGEAGVLKKRAVAEAIQAMPGGLDLMYRLGAELMQ